MEGRVVDPYEQQLYAVFESCDEGQIGSLDRKGLEQLCEQLQLEEQSVELIECLLGTSESNKRVTFSEFRDGLLTLLGEGQKKRESGGRGSPEREVSPKFVFGKKKYGRRSRPESTEQDSEHEESDTEIFVAIGDDSKEIIMRSVSETSPVGDAQHPKKRKTSSEQSQNLKRPPESKSSNGSYPVVPQSWSVDQGSESSAPPSLGPVGENEEECLRAAWERLGVGRDGFLDRNELALVCECIGMERFAEEVVQQLFEKLDIDRDGRISFEEFLLLFRSGGSWPTMTAQSEKSNNCSARPRTFQQRSGSSEERQALGSMAALDPNNTGMVSADALLEAWETAGVPKASSLLHSLGLADTQQLRVSELAAILEEELRGLAEERRGEEPGTRTSPCSPHETLLQATLALYQLEVRCLKSSLEHMSAERDKLRADIVDANERASLLAQEVDDHHARLEEASQLQIKMLEQRHIEQLRQVTEQLGSEREQLAAQSQVLERQVEVLQDDESRIRAELSTLQTENETLDRENQCLLEQLSESKQVRAQLQEEVESMASLQQRLSELEGCREQEQVLPLIEKMNELQAENTSLRDRIDELTIEMEDLTVRYTSNKLKNASVCLYDRSMCVQTGFDTLEEGSNLGGGTKRRGNSPLVLPAEESSEEESPRLGKVRRCCKGGCRDESLDTVNMEGLQIHSLIQGERSVDTDVEVDESESLYPGFRGKEPPPNKWPESRDAPDNVSRLSITELEHDQSDKLLVPEAEREMPEGGNLWVKGHLKQVFQLIRKQAVQEFLEDSELMSSRPHRYITQRNESECSVTNVALYSPHENAKDVEQLEQHCRDLKSQLDEVKVEIVKILSERKACSKENCALKIHISDLKNRLPLEDSGSPVHSMHANQLMSETRGCACMSENGDLQATKECTNVLAECVHKTVMQSAESSINMSSEALSSREEQEVERLSAKLSEAEERCRELEASLELLRQEYEKCEDYWASKLEEERHLYDQEQRLSDEKYAELMAKIREYEEQCGGANSDDSDDRLSTIEERSSLEKQVTDLEEECEEIRLRAEQEQAEKEAELLQLRGRLQAVEQRLQLAGCQLDVAVQVSDLENGSWESDRTFVVELDGARRACRRLKEQSVGLLNGYSRKDTCDDSSSSSPDTDMRRLQELKAQLEEECHMLRQQKEMLLHNGLAMPLSFSELSMHGASWHSGKPVGQACRVDLSVLQSLNSRLRQQEQRCRHLQQTLKQQQQHADSLLQKTWQQHKEQVSDLQSILTSTQDRLQQQTNACKDQMERLTRTDLLVKDLYVENAYLVATVQRLEQRCHVLLQMTSDSTSV